VLALILGGASCVWDDAAAAMELCEPDAVFAVNDIGTRWARPIRAWCSLHPERMQRWRAERGRRGFPAAFEHIGHERGHPGIDRVTSYLWPGMNASGSSGLFAVKVAMEAGYDRIILAGIPMQAEGAHFFNPASWGEVASFTEAWRIARPRLTGKVHSMSGWTKELLGYPSAEWLAGEPPPHMAG